MLLVARDAGNNIIATNQIVLPISDEMDCRACHASGTQTAAEPLAGWVWDGLPERDFRLNILRLHDERQFSQFPGLYQAALAARGFNPQGLYRNVTADGKPVLVRGLPCRRGAEHFEQLQQHPAVHQLPCTVSTRHVVDPVSNTTLDNVANRSACYRCHPGSTTRCLRGRDGRRDCRGWFHGNAMPELPRQHERWSARPVAPAGLTNRCAKAATPAPRSTTTAKSAIPRSLPIATNWTVRTAVDHDFRNQ